MIYFILLFGFLSGWYIRQAYVHYTSIKPERCTVIKTFTYWEGGYQSDGSCRCEHDSGHRGPCMVKFDGREYHFEPEFMK